MNAFDGNDAANLKVIGALDQITSRIDGVVRDLDFVAGLRLEIVGEPFVDQDLIIAHISRNELAVGRGDHRIRRSVLAAANKVSEVGQYARSVGDKLAERDVVGGV